MPDIDHSEKNIVIEPGYLNFGKFLHNNLLTDLPFIRLKVTNIGDETLAGRLISRMSWMIITPIEFILNKGDTSVHKIQLSTGVPVLLNLKQYSFEDLVRINTNRGEISIGGSFEIGAPKSKETAIFPWKRYYIPLILIFTIALILFISLMYPNPVSDQESELDTLYTSGAETIIVGLTNTEIARRFSNQTSTLSPLINLDTNVYIPTSPTQTQVPGSTQTYTPFPEDQYQNPEQFIYEYYNTINRRDFAQAWSMLSVHFQQTCCAIGGNDPFIVYKSWWSRISRVEVISAYLQEYKSNPARLNVALRYHFKDGLVEESFNIFYLVSDPSQKSLLLNEVR